MANTAEQAYAQVVGQFEPAFASDGLRIGEELFSVLDLLDENAGLRRALSDPARESGAKAELVQQLLGSKISAPALDALKALVSNRFSHDRDLSDSLEKLAATAIVSYAEAHGGGADALAQLEDSLFAFQDVVSDSHELQAALSQPQASGEAKSELALKLVPSATPEARTLISRAVSHPRGLKASALVRKFQELVAQRQKRYIADVSVARELSDQQLSRLQSGLNKVYRRDLNLNVHVQPELVGGIRVQVGDEVVDASVINRLHELNRHLMS